MQHYRSLDAVQLNNSWITIGSFDGVHRGHQRILSHLIEAAHAAHNPAVVVTFYPHPAVVLGRGGNGGYLSSPDERAELIGSFGVDSVVTIPFTHELATLSAFEFMQLLKKHLGLQHLFVGYDFALGRGREGNIERLREIGAELGYVVSTHSPVEMDGTPISSSHIRKAIRAGEVEQAASMLGRFYTVDGPVIHGDGRGKSLGFPTANIDYWKDRVLPASGVYATWAWVDGVRFPSVSSMGVRPTFTDTPPVPRLEAYIINFDEIIYGSQIRLEFVSHLRPEIKFKTVNDLINQMQIDTQNAAEVLSHAP